MESKLPKEIKSQIESEAKKVAIIVIYNEYDAGPVSSARTVMGSRIDPIQKEFYIKGATEWAQWKVAYDDLRVCYNAANKVIDQHEKENQQLKERCDKMEAALEWIKTYGPDQSIEGQAFIDKALKGKEVELSCVVCGTKFMGPEPKMCCSGRDCGCMGLPIDPIVCSKECYENLPSRRKDTECSVVGMCVKCGRHYVHKNESGLCNKCGGKEVSGE